MLFTVYHCQYPGFKTGANYSLLKQGRGCPPFFRGSIKWAWGSFHCKVRLPMPWMWTGRAKLMGVTQTNGSPKTGLFLLCFWFVLSKDAHSFFCVKKPLPLFLWPWPTLEVWEAAYSSEAGSGPFLDDVPERPGTAHRKARPRVGGRNSCAATWWNGVDVGEIAEWCQPGLQNPWAVFVGDKMIRML